MNNNKALHVGQTLVSASVSLSIMSLLALIPIGATAAHRWSNGRFTRVYPLKMTSIEKLFDYPVDVDIRQTADPDNSDRFGLLIYNFDEPEQEEIHVTGATLEEAATKALDEIKKAGRANAR